MPPVLTTDRAVSEAARLEVEEANARFYRAFRAAWEAVDTDARGLPVPLELDPVTIRAARDEAQAVRRPPSPLRRVVEPFRPPLERFGSIVLPLVGRAARRRATARVR